MSRKHFKALADELKANRPGENWDPNKHVQWDLDVKAIASVCKSFNGLFQREKFYDACGGLFNT